MLASFDHFSLTADHQEISLNSCCLCSGEINILSFLSYIRHQRACLVQVMKNQSTLCQVKVPIFTIFCLDVFFFFRQRTSMYLSTIALLRQLIAVKIIHISSANYQLFIQICASYVTYQYYRTQETNLKLFVKHLNLNEIFCRRD